MGYRATTNAADKVIVGTPGWAQQNMSQQQLGLLRPRVGLWWSTRVCLWKMMNTFLGGSFFVGIPFFQGVLETLINDWGVITRCNGQPPTQLEWSGRDRGVFGNHVVMVCVGGDLGLGWVPSTWRFLPSQFRPRSLGVAFPLTFSPHEPFLQIPWH